MVMKKYALQNWWGNQLNQPYYHATHTNAKFGWQNCCVLVLQFCSSHLIMKNNV